MPKDKNAKAAELIGSPDKLIGKIISNAKEKKWASDKITLSGPPHKQLQHTLVLQRLSILVAQTEKLTGKKFVAAAGETVETEEERALPVALSAASIKKIKTAGKFLEQIAAGPEHEILYTAILLQAIEFLLTAQGATSKG